MSDQPGWTPPDPAGTPAPPARRRRTAHPRPVRRHRPATPPRRTPPPPGYAPPPRVRAAAGVHPLPGPSRRRTAAAAMRQAGRHPAAAARHRRDPRRRAVDRARQLEGAARVGGARSSGRTRCSSSSCSWSLVGDTGFARTTYDVEGNPSFDINAAAYLSLVPLQVLQLFGQLVVTAVCAVVTSRAVLGERPTWQQTWDRARPQLGRLVGVGVLVALALGAGLLVCFVGIVYPWVIFSLAVPALLLERTGVTRALGRSNELVRGAWWRTFWLLLLGYLLVAVISFAVSLPFLLFGGAFNGIFSGDVHRRPGRRDDRGVGPVRLHRRRHHVAVHRLPGVRDLRRPAHAQRGSGPGAAAGDGHGTAVPEVISRHRIHGPGRHRPGRTRPPRPATSWPSRCTPRTAPRCPSRSSTGSRTWSAGCWTRSRRWRPAASSGWSSSRSCSRWSSSSSRCRVGPLRTAATADRWCSSGAARSAAEHRADAERAAAAGDWEEAVRQRFRALVRALEERDVLDERPGRTADEAAAEAARSMPASAAELAWAARQFDDVAYGGRHATQARLPAPGRRSTTRRLAPRWCVA